jgi:hypothetical protein
MVGNKKRMKKFTSLFNRKASTNNKRICSDKQPSQKIKYHPGTTREEPRPTISILTEKGGNIGFFLILSLCTVCLAGPGHMTLFPLVLS